MAKGRKDIYHFFLEEYGKELDYGSFTDMLCRFNEKIVDQLLIGKEVHMGHNMSSLSIARNRRDPACPRIDWKSTDTLKAQLLSEGKKLYDPKTKEGENYLVYYTDEYYVRFRWYKDLCKVKNKRAYRFDAARGTLGKSPKEKLAKIIQSDDLAYLNYRALNGRI